jgi:serine/threonine-protein kinase
MTQGGTGKPESGDKSQQNAAQPARPKSGQPKSLSGQARPSGAAPSPKPSGGSGKPASGVPKQGSSGASATPAGKSGSQPQILLGSYRIVERIGAGGMGTVYRAVHVELDREVALKVLPPEMNSNPTMVARFKREARAAAQLHHENIVQIYDVKEDKGRNFLALEFVRGQDLSDLITAKKQLPVRQAIDILKQASRALDHAFQKGIVHRDIKPSNFLITQDGKVKLCDMGLALRTDAGEESKVTRDGTTVGTVDYMSPEQARDSRLADTRSDIYSLGCTLYQMLTGRVPFEEGSIPEKLFKHNQDPVPDPLQFNPEIPNPVLYVLNRMLEKKPEDRYQNPKELLTDLEQLDLEESRAASTIKTLAIGTEADDAATEELVLQRPGGRSTMKRQQEEAERQAAARRKAQMLLFGGAGAAAVVLIGLVLWLVMRPRDTGGLAAAPASDSRAAGSPSMSSAPVPTPTPAITKVTATPPVVDAASSDTASTGSSPPAGNDESGEPDPKASEPDRSKTDITATTKAITPGEGSALPNRVTAAERERIAQELFPPWPTVAIPGSPVRLARGVQEERGGVFATFEAACRSAQSGSSKINVEDAGPFFQRSFSVIKANLEIRPVYGERQQNAWRPVVVFDTNAKKGDPYGFQAKGSNLVIEGIDFVVNADDLRDSIGLTPFALFDIQGGDLVLKNCTFTILGKHAMSVSLVRFSGLRDTPDPARQPERLTRLTLEGCFARGEPLAAVTLASGLADIKIIDSLFVGGQMGTMLELLPPTDPTARPERTLRFIRSTFITRGDFIFMDGSSGGDVTTNFKLLDTIIACSASSAARKLIKLKSWPDTSGVFAKATWDERSSLYTGWGENLVYSTPPAKLSAKTAEAWLRLWGLQPADSHVRSDAWPKQDLGELAACISSSFGASEVATGIQSRWGAPSIGCNVDQLPALSPMVYERSFGRVEAPQLLALERLLPSFTYDSQKNSLLGTWKGEQNRRRQALPGTLKPDDELDPVLELAFNVNSGGDLGKFLMSQPELPDTTIVVVSGSGTHKMSPVRLAGKRSLVLHFPQKSGQALVLTPADAAEPVEALIEVRDGDLIIEGAIFAWPTSASTDLPRRFIKVDRGNLTLAGCRLFGPLQSDTGFEAIAFSGGAQKSKPPAAPTTPVHLDFHPAPNPIVNVCQLLDSYVGADSHCLRFVGSQGVLRLSNCIAVTPGTIVSFEELDLGGAQTFQVDVIVEQCTMAASKSFFEVGEWIAPVMPSRPMAFSTRDNLFCDPFEVAIGAAARTRSNIFLRYGGRTLQQGLLSWHSEYDAFSNDIHGYIQRKGSTANPRQEFDQQWQAVWGRLHVTDEVVDGMKIDKIRLVGKPTASASPKLKEFERDKKLSDLALQDQCEATKKASHGGRVGADLKRVGP